MNAARLRNSDFEYGSILRCVFDRFETMQAHASEMSVISWKTAQTVAAREMFSLYWPEEAWWEFCVSLQRALGCSPSECQRLALQQCKVIAWVLQHIIGADQLEKHILWFHKKQARCIRLSIPFCFDLRATLTLRLDAQTLLYPADTEIYFIHRWVELFVALSREQNAQDAG